MRFGAKTFTSSVEHSVEQIMRDSVEHSHRNKSWDLAPRLLQVVLNIVFEQIMTSWWHLYVAWRTHVCAMIYSCVMHDWLICATRLARPVEMTEHSRKEKRKKSDFPIFLSGPWWIYMWYIDICTHTYIHVNLYIYIYIYRHFRRYHRAMGWLWLVGSIKL